MAFRERRGYALVIPKFNRLKTPSSDGKNKGAFINAKKERKNEEIHKTHDCGFVRFDCGVYMLCVR